MSRYVNFSNIGADSFGKYESCGILKLIGQNFLNPNVGLNISLNEEVIFRILEMENFIIYIMQ